MPEQHGQVPPQYQHQPYPQGPYPPQYQQQPMQQPLTAGQVGRGAVWVFVLYPLIGLGMIALCCGGLALIGSLGSR